MDRSKQVCAKEANVINVIRSFYNIGAEKKEKDRALA